MFLLGSNEGALQNSYAAIFEGASISPANIAQRIWVALQAEERPAGILWFTGVWVLLFHLWVLTLLTKPEENLTEAKPLPMEVSVVTIPKSKPAVEAPAKPVMPPAAKKQPDVAKPKPVLKKPAPAIQKAPAEKVQDAPDFAPFEPFKPMPLPQASQTANSNSNSNASAKSADNAAASSSNSDTYTEANFRANYDHNPKPDYPAIAKSRDWQGKVLLRVKVSAQGLSDDVTVEKSSGHEILDDSAIEAVKKWRFIPAKRGDTPVASSVIVPINFTLQKH